jgi:hypothetical protein
MTPTGKRIQTLNPPGSEVGPSGTVAVWGKAITDEVNAPEVRFEWKRKGRRIFLVGFCDFGSEIK